ncbi:MAG: hypothetical protein Kow00105_09110 [Phycisphaeraceae bacterium]
MRSWVRYSVWVYVGLLLAGTISSPGLSPRADQPPMAEVRTDGYTEPAVRPTKWLLPTAAPDERAESRTMS